MIKTEIVFNPQSKQLIIKDDKLTSGSVCRIFNLTGSLCLEQQVTASSISLAGLHRGLYIVSLNTTEGVVTKKILVR